MWKTDTICIVSNLHSPLADKSVVAAAIAGATSRRDALLALGLIPHSRTYGKLAEACAYHGLSLPSRVPDREAISKQCAGCGGVLPIDAFAIRRNSTGLRQSKCRTCRSALRADHYQRNKKRLTREIVQRKREVKLRNMIRIVQYLTSHPCVDCGEGDPMVLQFDHINGDKVDNVTAMLHLADWSKIATEIAKCAVRCANCHHRRTATSLGWLRAVVAQQVGHLPSKQA